MNLKEIKELIDLITEKGISDFELERSGVRLKISRNASSRAVETVIQRAADTHAPAEMNHPAPPVLSSPAPGQPAPEAQIAAAAPAEELYVVHSPMVGTFYGSATQESTPFVQIGDRVQPGQVICIIEAMKLMNEIEAEVAGEVVTCYVENGQPVEYGEPLFGLRHAVSSKRPS